ncbi:Response regulator/sensory box/HDIG domain protein [hydrothermal vent metagenome]|uniref:Response regulator/sensory box/HDIG domain protein n=1 Tax=hydrothermal vent metagenome TaxID=652676 RepID=A0A3B0WZG6_9ZZZZ
MTDYGIDEELIRDFLGEFADSIQELKDTLALDDNEITQEDRVNQLFRCIHSIKSNLRMVGLDALSDSIHTLENTLDDIRDNRLEYTLNFSFILRSTIIQVYDLAESQYQKQDISSPLLQLNQAIQLIGMSEPGMLDKISLDVLLLIDPHADHYTPLETNETPVIPVEATKDPIFEKVSSTIHDDLDYFQELSENLDHILPRWKNRAEHMVELCLNLNHFADDKVDPIQLKAAALLHDMGMAYIPQKVLNNPGKLDCDELILMQNHCRLVHEWLRRLPNWQPASTMVYQHHEHYDGSGYPQGLSGDKICEGARIISIADAYTSLTSDRPYRDRKHPMVKAIMVINSNSGSQFDPDWVTLFNNMIKQRQH